ncbi:MAG: D-alanyl-D-alanine carboxypeptidase [Burkholderiaceae bacterium]
MLNSSSRRDLPRLSRLACVSLLVLAGCGGEDLHDTPLPSAISSVMAKPIYRNAVWGLRVVDRDSGAVLYDVNPNRNLLIGSVRKAFSVGVTLDALGASHRFRTPVYRTGTVDPAGALYGDLILVASGDMSMGGRVNADGSYAITDLDHNEANELGDAQLTAPDPLAGYRSLATQIAAAGITHVRGDVIIDERLWEAFDFRKQFLVSPIFVNDDVVDVEITPGSIGASANVTSRPMSSAFQVQSTLATDAPGAAIDVTLTSVLPTCIGTLPCSGVVSGSVPFDLVGPLTGRLPLVRTFRITQTAAYARTVLIEALAAAGVAVDAPAVAPNAGSRLPTSGSYGADTQVAELVSATYAEQARHIMKVSYNIGADTSLMHYGLTRGVRTLADSLVVERHALTTEFGLAAADMNFVDGSGDGETRARNVAVTGLLTAMTKRAAFADYLDTFPLLGVDGSMATITGFEADATLAGARGQVQAKTGTFVEGTPTNQLSIRAEAFAGYIHSRSGRNLVYHLVVNDLEPVAGFAELLTVIQDLGVLSAVIWRDN